MCCCLSTTSHVATVPLPDTFTFLTLTVDPVCPLQFSGRDCGCAFAVVEEAAGPQSALLREEENLYCGLVVLKHMHVFGPNDSTCRYDFQINIEGVYKSAYVSCYDKILEETKVKREKV